MTKTRLFLLLLLCFFATGCKGSYPSEFKIQVVNEGDFARTGDLEIKVCANQAIEIAELAVTIYVTENEEWEKLRTAQPYEYYFVRDLVNIPGTVSAPLPTDLWSPLADGCYAAEADGLFVHTEDWTEYEMCPFRAIVVVATYQTGTLNAAEIFECSLLSS